MRIAVITGHLHFVGGIETYLASVLPALAARGHSVALWHEIAAAAGRTPIVSDSIAVHQIDIDSLDATRKSLSDWQPDIVFLQGLSTSMLEEAFSDIAPLVRFLHTYAGSCISGTKTRGLRSAAPCSRTFGPGCLLHYYPQHCGGWHPLTMLNAYRDQQRRQHLLRRTPFVATLSQHMRREAIAHGADPVRTIHVPAFVTQFAASVNGSRPERALEPNDWHLLFAGRLQALKGAHLLLDALETLHAQAGRPLRVTFAGDGPDRERLTRRAASFTRSKVAVNFVGWLPAREYSSLLESVHLLVVPSVWPEPLGLVGLEAAAAGVPAVAFDAGGISEWLCDGSTGRLVRATPPSGSALAEALADSLSDPRRLRDWSLAAVEHSRKFTIDAHVDALESVFRRATEARMVA